MINAATSDADRRAVLLLARRFKDGKTCIEHHELAEATGLDERGVWRLADKLAAIHVLTWESTNRWVIHAGACDAAREIVNPPHKDYWRDFGVWFRSQWWSLPFVFLLVGIPLITLWIMCVLALRAA